jgi:hypothetical protein
LTDISVAEEALCLPAAERAKLAGLLIESLETQAEADDQVRAELIQRLERLKAGSDAGLTFQETIYFLGFVHERHHPDFLKHLQRDPDLPYP